MPLKQSLKAKVSWEAQPVCELRRRLCPAAGMKPLQQGTGSHSKAQLRLTASIWGKSCSFPLPLCQPLQRVLQDHHLKGHAIQSEGMALLCDTPLAPRTVHSYADALQSAG